MVQFPSESLLDNRLIARQPILNRNEEIISYELLFRSVCSREAAIFSNSSYATANVVLNTLADFGIEEVIGPYRGFINIDHELLMSDTLELLPRERVVLELLETLELTPALVQRCQELKRKGFSLALDDHQYSETYHDLYRTVDIVKIDVMQSTPSDVEQMVRQFHQFPVQLLAEKVETKTDFQRCHELGFNYFQGFYFAKPSLLEKRPFDENTATLLKLTGLLATDAEIDEIEQTFRRSPSLTYKLLKLVNSAMVGLRTQISSIRHAMLLLGRRQLQRWTQLAMFASESNGGASNPLVDMAAVRACFMEQLAKIHPVLRQSELGAEHAFMVGILSLLEVIYSVQMGDVITDLNLSTEVAGALVDREGILGCFLGLAETLDQSYGVVDTQHLSSLGVSEADVLSAQIKAFQWYYAAA